MNWEAIGAIGEIIGAIAVVLTLAYLAMQIRQNAKGQRATSFQAWAEAKAHPVNSAQSADLANAIASIRKLDEMSHQQAVQIGHWFHSLIHIGETSYYLHKEKVLSDSIYETELQRSAATINIPAGKQWWEAGARTQFTPEFVAEIENYAKNTDNAYKTWSFVEGEGFKQN